MRPRKSQIRQAANAPATQLDDFSIMDKVGFSDFNYNYVEKPIGFNVLARPGH